MNDISNEINELVKIEQKQSETTESDFLQNVEKIVKISDSVQKLKQDARVNQEKLDVLLQNS